jgi:hypothetical protein
MLDAFWLSFIVWDLCLIHQIWRLGAFAMYYLYLVILYLLIFLELLTSLLVYFVIHFLFNESINIPIKIIRRKYNTMLYYTTLLQHPRNGIIKLFFTSKKELWSITTSPLTNMSLFVTQDRRITYNIFPSVYLQMKITTYFDTCLKKLHSATEIRLEHYHQSYSCQTHQIILNNVLKLTVFWQEAETCNKCPVLQRKPYNEQWGAHTQIHKTSSLF